MTRLDVILVNKGLVSTRTRAEQVITTHGVLVEGILVTKPGKKFPDEVTIQLIEDEIPWVSKGAIKLLAAIEKWNLSAANETCLDIGASTGGFTEVLLHLGAKKVYAVDVGQHQLHSKLRNDNRIVNLEKTHVRELTKNLVSDVHPLHVVDVSFISLTKVLPFLHPFLKNGAKVVLLIKPQFEVGKENLNKNGIVVNKLIYPEITEKIKTSARQNQLEFIDIIDSPILGGDGNREFLAYFCKANEC
ncbi:MAG TPA: TlyA family rRNA (cytidine-2'-O)-methyltransferase [Crocinitomicaceae bacterium]|nr:TlyA family rRNA (cytidine-2'-O)-methyltransferase [Crocinitomicaceae bacterium]